MLVVSSLVKPAWQQHLLLIREACLLLREVTGVQLAGQMLAMQEASPTSGYSTRLLTTRKARSIWILHTPRGMQLFCC